MKLKPLLINEVDNRVLQENFQRLQNFLGGEIVMNAQWRLLELPFTQNGVGLKIPHKLGFQPKDLIQTSIRGAGAITYDFASFDDTNIVVTVSGTDPASPLVIRCLVGRIQ